MCTTALLIGTLVVMLRRRFFNKVEPYAARRSSLQAPLQLSDRHEKPCAAGLLLLEINCSHRWRPPAIQT
uniref:Uncharacterized protein n=1 Tax=Anas zonorhyncha TaxID=75864 RepID=A0A8C0A0N6_9AVES